jgi:vitamin B12 transporter
MGKSMEWSVEGITCIMTSKEHLSGSTRHAPKQFLCPNRAGLPASLTMFLYLLIWITLYAGVSSKVFGYTSASELEPVVVTGTRSEQRPEEVAANVAVITREEIESLPAHTVSEALNYVPGLFVFMTGGLGGQATSSIHGSSDRQVAVYLDGVPLNMMANPIADLAFLPLNNMERIEVYKGGASSAWGSALGGVINIISRSPIPGRLHGSLDTSVGQNMTLDSNAFVSGSLSRLNYFLSTGHVETNGPINQAEHERDNIYTKFTHPFTQSTDLVFTLNYTNGRSQNPLPTEVTFFGESRYRRFFQTLTLRSSPSDWVHLEFGLRNQRFVNRQDRIFIQPFERVNRFELVERLYGATFKSVWETGSGNTFVAGADGDWDSYSFSQLGRGDLSSRNLATYVNDTLTLGPFTATAGLRLDHNEDFGSEVSPSAGMVYRLDRWEALLRFQISRAFSAPPLNFLFFPEIGNPDLKPETGIDYQFGAEINIWKTLLIKFDLFLAKIDRLIRFDPAQNLLVNIDKVTRRGVEASMRLDIPYGFEAFVGATYIKVKDDRTGEEIKDTPGLTWDVIFTHQYRDMVRQSLTGKYIWYNSSLAETRDNNFLFDYLIRVKVPADLNGASLSLFGAVHNLFNSTQFFQRDFPAPSRWMEAGIRFDF